MMRGWPVAGIPGAGQLLYTVFLFPHDMATTSFRPHRILNLIFAAALLAMGGGISYNSHRFAYKRVKQGDL